MNSSALTVKAKAASLAGEQEGGSGEVMGFVAVMSICIVLALAAVIAFQQPIKDQITAMGEELSSLFTGIGTNPGA